MINNVTYRALTVSGLLSHAVQLKSINQMSWSYNPTVAVTTLVWAPPRSLATTRGIISYFLFLRVLRCFSSPGLPLIVKLWLWALPAQGLPHSEMLGLTGMCPSPNLIAAYRVLPRL